MVMIDSSWFLEAPEFLATTEPSEERRNVVPPLLRYYNATLDEACIRTYPWWLCANFEYLIESFKDVSFFFYQSIYDGYLHAYRAWDDTLDLDTVADLTQFERYGATMQHSLRRAIINAPEEADWSLFASGCAVHGATRAIIEDRDFVNRGIIASYKYVVNSGTSDVWRILAVPDYETGLVTTLEDAVVDWWRLRKDNTSVFTKKRYDDDCTTYLCNPTCASSLEIRNDNELPIPVVAVFLLWNLGLWPVVVFAIVFFGMIRTKDVVFKAHLLQAAVKDTTTPDDDGCCDDDDIETAVVHILETPTPVDDDDDEEASQSNEDTKHEEEVVVPGVVEFLATSNLSYWISKKPILEDVTVAVHAGVLTGVVGPSGAGKTTLIEVMARVRQQGRLAGDLSLGGVSLVGGPDVGALRAWYARRSVFVPQVDVFHGNLTVRQIALHATYVSLPHGVPTSEKLRRASDLIQSLGLDECLDTIAGDGGVAIEGGLSGGQRRRLSVFQKMISKPIYAFLDEYVLLF